MHVTGLQAADWNTSLECKIGEWGSLEIVRAAGALQDNAKETELN